MKSRIIIYGSLAYDYRLRTSSHLPNMLSESELNKDTTLCPVQAEPLSFGGNGGNIAWHVALLGQEPILLSCVGNDGAAYLDRLHSANIDTSYITQIIDVPTTSVWFLEDQDSHSIAFFDDRSSKKRTWNRAFEIDRNDIVHIAPGRPDVTLSAIEAVKDSVEHLIWDPGQDLGHFSPTQAIECLKSSTILILNQQELRLLLIMLQTDMEEVLRLIPIVIETQGQNGAVIHQKNNKPTHIQAILPQYARSGWGAGDGLRSGFLYALSKGKDLIDSVSFGCSLASLIVEIQETQLSRLTCKDVETRLHAN